MAAHGEIITLQFGHFSNYIGAHWWNIQELGFDYTSSVPSEVNHDILFREGETKKGEVTFTPRMLLVDLQGSLGNLPQHGGLYDDDQIPDPSRVTWEQPVEVVKKESSEPNEFQADLENQQSSGQPVSPKKIYNLDSSVNVWSDYLRTAYHPRSFNIVKRYSHKSESAPFDAFPQGTSLWTDEQFEDNFVDQLRRYAEECDSLQGFHVLVDAIDGFGGLGTNAIQYLSDEYGRKSVFGFPSVHGSYLEVETANEGLRMANMALCLQNLSHHCSLIVPLSMSRGFWQQKTLPRDFSYLRYNASLQYHTSAILALALDCASMRYRLRGAAQGGMADLTHELAIGGRKAVAASLALPFPMKRGAYLLDTLEEWEGPLWQSVSSGCDTGEDRVWAQSVVLRGIPAARLKKPDDTSHIRSTNPAYSCATVDAMLRYFLECTCMDTASHVTTLNAPCEVGAPFPHIFDPYVSHDGFIDSSARPDDVGVLKVPVLAGLHTCRSTGAMLGSLQGQAARLNWRKLAQLGEAGLEKDDFSESLEQLLTFAECYNEEFEV